MGQDLDGFQNLANALGRRACVKLGDVLKEAVEIVKDFRGQLDAGEAFGGMLGRASRLVLLVTTEGCGLRHKSIIKPCSTGASSS